ncbi:MAG: LPXTG cell wall anchor domain-containing protein [Flavobacteriaceae bacterium]|nr:LPXTG cell wall anchor domain-containing protein [Flavobacteriaceae bacterium]
MDLSFKTIALHQGKAFQYGFEIGSFIGQNWVMFLILSIMFIFLIAFFILFRKKKEGTEL